MYPSLNKVFIIAEAGVNHNGSLEMAKKLIDIAKKAGADAVKFQTFKAERLVTSSAVKADYQIQNTVNNETQFEMIKKLELTEEAHFELFDYCKRKKIIFISTPFDLKSIDFLNKLGLEIIKIGSGEITNLPYLRKIGSLKKQIIVSTGMSDMGEIEDALDILIESGTSKDNISILHCNTEYPTDYSDVNLMAMRTIKKAFNINVGYSDHTLGIEVAIAAVAMGASIIEKHITIDKNAKGPDHKASLEPEELIKLVRAIRNVEKSFGNGIKKPSKSEVKNIPIARKSIVASKKIKGGEMLSENNITVKRPGTGISPMEWDNIIGTIANKDYDEDDLI